MYPTILVAPSDISSAQSNGTKATKKETQKLLDYCATHPNAEFRNQKYKWKFTYIATYHTSQHQNQ